MRTQLVSAKGVITGAGRLGSALLVEDGLVSAIGDFADLRAASGVTHEYGDGYIVPGFRDAHIHAIPYAALLTGCSLKTAESIPHLIRRLETYADTLARDAPVVAYRFDDETLAEGRLPTRSDLDRAVPDRSAVIYRYCGHVAVANSFALNASGIDIDTPDPEGGIIDRDATGTPTGVLRETAAGLISSALARGGPLAPEALIDGLTRLAGLGITSVGAMIGYGESPFAKLEAESALLREVADRLPLRVNVFSIAATPADLAASRSTITYAGDRLRWLGVKRFSDGSLGGHTAAMCSPFSDVDTLGTLRLTDEDIVVSKHALELGGMVAIHAIGDRAIGEVLDVFEQLIVDGAAPGDLRMEHVSIASPQLLDRFAEAGVHAVVQPAFLASESEWLPARLGVDRMAWAYPFHSMLDRGINVAGSSDSVVEPPHPLWGMAAAMHRHGIGPDQALTGLEAIELFTGAAAAALREREPLAIGSPADFAVIDVDIRTASHSEVRDAQVLDTWIGGERVEVDRSLPAWVD
jgi:hypothetical protein